MSLLDADGAGAIASTRKLLDLVESKHPSLIIVGHDGPQWRRSNTSPTFTTNYKPPSPSGMMAFSDTGSKWKLATRAWERERLRALRDLDTAALQLRDACLVLLDTAHPEQ